MRGKKGFVRECCAQFQLHFGTPEVAAPEQAERAGIHNFILRVLLARVASEHILAGGSIADEHMQAIMQKLGMKQQEQVKVDLVTGLREAGLDK